MTHLTAAHPTMPLPSYARVTNTENGSSVIVRVNDRGPYSHGRLIDLSKRAAEMLDYTHSGTAKVKVEYVGRAPLDGAGRRISDGLLPARQPCARSVGRPADRRHDRHERSDAVASVGSLASAFPGELADAATPAALGNLDLPAFGPIAPERPAPDGMGGAQLALASLSYAENTRPGSAAAFAALTSDKVVESWKRMNPDLADTTSDRALYRRRFVHRRGGCRPAGAQAGGIRTHRDREVRYRRHRLVRRQPARRRPPVARRPAAGRLGQRRRRRHHGSRLRLPKSGGPHAILTDAC